ncbi:MAG: hypothetical protein M1823_007123 [Watsoniomyces obsoletus]|nr:MAG: hypothetical protein M1823_007123 [Watsoniomyces obsoletus]
MEVVRISPRLMGRTIRGLLLSHGVFCSRTRIRGGSTMIGPHTPSWFSVEEESVYSPDEAAAVEASETPTGKTTRHQRRKAKRRRDEARATAKPVIRIAPLTLTAIDDARISKLRIVIAGTQAEVRRAQDRLASERRELADLLKKYGLPLDRLPEGY